MPIRNSQKHLYPPNWKQISHRIRFERAGGRCEQCGVRHGAMGYREADGTFVELSEAELNGDFASEWDVPGKAKIIKIVLTTAHLNHDPRDNRDEVLAALCQRCHLRLDIDHHRQTRAATKRAQLRAAGARELFGKEAADV